MMTATVESVLAMVAELSAEDKATLLEKLQEQQPPSRIYIHPQTGLPTIDVDLSQFSKEHIAWVESVHRADWYDHEEL